jgi:hypothetical protein
VRDCLRSDEFNLEVTRFKTVSARFKTVPAKIQSAICESASSAAEIANRISRMSDAIWRDHGRFTDNSIGSAKIKNVSAKFKTV